MANLRVITLECGDFETNTYLLLNEQTRECVIIDPSDNFDLISGQIEENELTPVAIYITHGHDDHIGSVNDLKRRYQLLVYIMKEEEEFISSVNYNLSHRFGRPRIVEADMFFIDNQTVAILGTEMRTILTPGHTPGGCCYFFSREGILFTGDTLFEESIGRTDFPGGYTEDLIRSINEKLMVLPDTTICYPGHGPATTIGHERKYNPFISDDDYIRF